MDQLRDQAKVAVLFLGSWQGGRRTSRTVYVLLTNLLVLQGKQSLELPAGCGGCR